MSDLARGALPPSTLARLTPWDISAQKMGRRGLILATLALAACGGGREGAGVASSPIKIACHVPSSDVDAAVRALHEAFELA